MSRVDRLKFPVVKIEFCDSWFWVFRAHHNFTLSFQSSGSQEIQVPDWIRSDNFSQNGGGRGVPHIFVEIVQPPCAPCFGNSCVHGVRGSWHFRILTRKLKIQKSPLTHIFVGWRKNSAPGGSYDQFSEFCSQVLKSFPVFLFGMMMFFLQLEVPCFPTVRFGLFKNRLGVSRDTQLATGFTRFRGFEVKFGWSNLEFPSVIHRGAGRPKPWFTVGRLPILIFIKGTQHDYPLVFQCFFAGVSKPYCQIDVSFLVIFNPYLEDHRA